MRYKKRRKASRFRGSHTHGRGFKKKARGSGHRGGFGMAGTGKRGDQRKTLILNLPEPYFGKSKIIARKQAPKPEVINLQQISDNIQTFVKKGIAKEFKGHYEISLPKYKILSNGSLTIKAKIKAKAASAGAIEKIKAADSSIELDDSSDKQEAPAVKEKPAKVSKK